QNVGRGRNHHRWGRSHDGTEEGEPDPEGEVDASTRETWCHEQRHDQYPCGEGSLRHASSEGAVNTKRARMLRPAKPHPERQAVSVATEPILGNAEPGPRVGVTRRGPSVGAGAAPPLLPAVAAGEGVALDALVPPDEHVPVD